MHTTHPNTISILLPRAIAVSRAVKPPGPLAPRVVGSLQALIGISALISGLLMVARPDGGALGLDPHLLQGPFETFRVPGLILGLGLGSAFLISSWLTLGFSRFARVGTLISAFLLIGFIAGQMAFLAGTSGLQLVCLAMSLGLAAMTAFSAAR